jgi:oligopeptide transport system substrate-binding protein
MDGTTIRQRTAARARWLAAPLLAAMLLAGCGGGDDAVAPGENTVLRRGNGQEPGTLDTHLAEGSAALAVLRDLYEGLTAESRTGEVVPGAAERWEIDDGALTYRFFLRRDGRWSNGDPVVAGDFVAGLRRLLDPSTASTYAQILLPLVNAADIIAGDAPVETLGVEAVDDYTLEIRLERPTPYLLGLLNHPSTFPIHRASLVKHGGAFSRAGNLVSNGPYRLVRWQIGSKITLERNPFYWDAGSIAYNQVEFYPIEDASVEMNRFRAGELDLTSSVPNSPFDRLVSDFGDELQTNPYLSTYFYVFDTAEAPLDDVRLRQALSMAVDRTVLSELVLGAGQPGAWGLIPPGVADYESFRYEWSAWPREQQLEEARRLYAAAGYSPDNPLRIEILYNTSDNHRKVAVAIQGMLREHLGVDAALLNQEWKVMLQTRRDRSAWDILRFGWTGDYNDAYTFLEIFQSNSALNPSGFEDAQYDALLSRASRESDTAARAQLLHEAEARIMTQYPIMPLYFYVARHLVSKRVAGYRGNIMDHIYSRHLRPSDASAAP